MRKKQEETGDTPKHLGADGRVFFKIMVEDYDIRMLLVLRC